MKKLVVDSKQREYFFKHQTIEFEGLIPENKLKDVQEALMSTLAERVKVVPASVEELFFKGRDLWRSNAILKKWITLPQYAGIVAELYENREIRLGFDQYIPSPTSQVMIPATRDLYHFLDKKPTLEAMSSIQGVVCGLILCIREPLSEEGTPAKLFSTKAGSGVYLMPETPLDFTELEQRIGGEYLLVVYAKLNAVYIRQEEDPLSISFKKLGYSYGDKLSDKLNPRILK